MIWLTILGISVVVVYYIVLRRRTTVISQIKGPHSMQSENYLSIDEARVMVQTLVMKDEKLVAENAGRAVVLPEGLSPTTKEFFSNYGALKTRRGGFRIAVSDVKPSEYASGFISIGHSEDWDVIQKPGNDEVFVIEGAETSADEMEVRFQSVYHLVLDEVKKS